jgi:hypothetical protein
MQASSVTETPLWAAWKPLERPLSEVLSEVAAQWKQADESGDVPAQLQAAVAWSTLLTFARQVHPSLLGLAAKTRVLSALDALGVASIHPDAGQRVEMLRAIFSLLDGAQQQKALNLMRQETVTEVRANVLSLVARSVTDPDILAAVLKEGMEAAAEMADRERAADLLCEVERSLPPSKKSLVVPYALAMQEAAEDERVRTKLLWLLLFKLGSYVAQTDVFTLLERVRTLSSPQIRSELLAALAPFLPEEARLDVLLEGVMAARECADESWQIKALVTLARYLPEEQRVPRVHDALEAALAFDSVVECGRSLEWLAPYLTLEQRVEAIPLVLKQLYEREAAHEWVAVVGKLAPYLGREAIREQQELARAVAEPYWKACALNELAPYLLGKEREEATLEAWEATRVLEDPQERLEMLTLLIESLDGDDLQRCVLEAMSTARSFPQRFGPNGQTRALERLAIQLPEHLRRMPILAAIDLCRRTGDEDARLQVVAPLLLLLDGERQQTLAEQLRRLARTMAPVPRVEALLLLLSYVDDGQRVELARELVGLCAPPLPSALRAKLLVECLPALPAEQQGAAWNLLLDVLPETDRDLDWIGELSAVERLSASAAALPVDRILEVASAVSDRRARGALMLAALPQLRNSRNGADWDRSVELVCTVAEADGCETLAVMLFRQFSMNARAQLLKQVSERLKVAPTAEDAWLLMRSSVVPMLTARGEAVLADSLRAALVIREVGLAQRILDAASRPVSDVQRAAVLTEAMRLAREAGEKRGAAQLPLLPHMSERRRREASQSIVGALNGFDDVGLRLRALREAIPHLDEGTRDEALLTLWRDVLSMTDAEASFELMSQLLMLGPPPPSLDVAGKLDGMSESQQLAYTLALGPQRDGAGGAQVAEWALETVVSMRGDERLRQRLMATVAASGLDTQSLRPAWSRLLHKLAERERRELFNALRLLVPLIAVLVGNEASAVRAIATAAWFVSHGWKD